MQYGKSDLYRAVLLEPTTSGEYWRKVEHGDYHRQFVLAHSQGRQWGVRYVANLKPDDEVSGELLAELAGMCSHEWNGW